MNDTRFEAYLLAIVFLLAVNAVVTFFGATSAGDSVRLVPFASVSLGTAVVVTFVTLLLAIVFIPSRD